MKKLSQLNWLLIAAFVAVVSTGAVLQQQLTPKDIIRKAEEKTRGVKSSYSEMTITTVRKRWTREMSMKSWSLGDDFSLIVITAPAKDKGSATLKRHKEVWSWMPSIERIIKLPPSMMGQSWMGTDLTNDDLVKESSTITDYTHQLLADTTIAGKLCYKIQLTPKEDVAVVWGKIISCIDKADFIQLRSEMYDEDGYLVNVMNSSDIKMMAGVKMATKMEFIPVEEEGKKTIMQFDSLKVDLDIEESFFTTQNMKRVR